MSKMSNLLENIANEYRNIDLVKAAFMQLWNLEKSVGIEKAVIAITLNPGGNNLTLDVNSMTAAYLVGLTREYRSAREAWIESLDFMGDNFESEEEVELTDSPF